MLLCVLYSDDWELSLDSEKRENKSYLESQVNVDTLSIYFLVIWIYSCGYARHINISFINYRKYYAGC